MRIRNIARLAASAISIAWPIVGALAHPMGNFTISHYAELTPTRGSLRLLYVLDLAELPTIAERQVMDKSSDGEISEREQRAYLANRVPARLAGLTATADGRPLAW